MGILVQSVGLTVALFLATSFGLGWLIAFLVPDEITLPLIGKVEELDNLLAITAIPILLALSVFLMVPVASLFMELFIDRIVRAVEDRHYPHLPPATPQPMLDALRDAARFAAVFVVANLAAIVIYLAVPPLAPVTFWAVNGYLLGREYFTAVATRRMPRADAHALRRRHRLRVWMAGTAIAVPLTLPLVNLFVPLLGVATITHQFHRLATAR